MNRCVCRILSNSKKVVHPMVGIGWGCVLQAEYVLGSNTEVQGYKWKASSDNLLMNLSTSSPAGSCSHWYPGNRPFQAPEVNNMENYFSRLPRLKAFLDLRSYGQMCMFNPLSMTDSSLMPFFSVHAVLLFMQEKPERCRGSVRSHFGGGSRNEEVAWYSVHCKSQCPFFFDRSRSSSVFQTGQLCSTLYRSVGRLSFHSSPFKRLSLLLGLPETSSIGCIRKWA